MKMITIGLGSHRGATFAHAQGAEGTGITAAHSDDGVAWVLDADEPVLGPGEEGAWDASSVSHPAVMSRGGVYEMWYSSAGLRLGHAISEDGLTMTFKIKPDATFWDGRKVTGLRVAVDRERLEQVLRQQRSHPGIVDIQVEIAADRDLSIGDDVMLLVVAGDIREHVIETLSDTLNAIKTTVTAKTEFFV